MRALATQAVQLTLLLSLGSIVEIVSPMTVWYVILKVCAHSVPQILTTTMVCAFHPAHRTMRPTNSHRLAV